MLQIFLSFLPFNVNKRITTWLSLANNFIKGTSTFLNEFLHWMKWLALIVDGVYLSHFKYFLIPFNNLLLIYLIYSN